jgi:Zn-finger nucleic acid-binding protein
MTPTPKTCPTCKLPLYPAEITGQPLEHCAECQGLVIGRDAMMKLQPHGPKTIELSAAERDYKRPPFFEPRKKPPFLICPLCGKRMAESKLGPVAVDLCQSCQALWLDGPKTEGFNDLIGPYKWRITNDKKGAGSSRLQRMKDSL